MTVTAPLLFRAPAASGSAPFRSSASAPHPGHRAYRRLYAIWEGGDKRLRRCRRVAARIVETEAAPALPLLRRLPAFGARRARRGGRAGRVLSHRPRLARARDGEALRRRSTVAAARVTLQGLPCAGGALEDHVHLLPDHALQAACFCGAATRSSLKKAIIGRPRRKATSSPQRTGSSPSPAGGRL